MSPMGSCLLGWMRMRKVAGNCYMKKTITVLCDHYTVVVSSKFTWFWKSKLVLPQDQRARAAVSYQRTDESLQERAAELHRPPGCPQAGWQTGRGATFCKLIKTRVSHSPPPPHFSSSNAHHSSLHSHFSFNCHRSRCFSPSFCWSSFLFCFPHCLMPPFLNWYFFSPCSLYCRAHFLHHIMFIFYCFFFKTYSFISLFVMLNTLHKVTQGTVFFIFQVWPTHLFSCFQHSLETTHLEATVEF